MAEPHAPPDHGPDPRPGPVPGAGHYFSPDRPARSRPGTVAVPLGDRVLDLATDAGVFSPRRLDPGTALLLDHAPDPPPDARHLADVGCGYGPIALVLADRVPGATVWAVDTNPRAVELCAANAAAAGFPGVRASVATPDAPCGDLPDDVVLDAFWSNPPIRIGKAALHVLLARWLGRLRPGGEAVLVVQRHLGADSLHRWLEQGGRPTERVRSRAGYRLLRVRIPEPEAGP